jgi:hypothetical protein
MVEVSDRGASACTQYHAICKTSPHCGVPSHLLPHLDITCVTHADATRDLCRADLLTKLCQLAHARSVPPLLSHAFRLLAPVLEPSFITLSPFLSSRPGTKKGEYAAHRHVFNAYGAT